MEESLLTPKQGGGVGRVMRALIFVGVVSVVSLVLTLSFGIAVVVQHGNQATTLDNIESKPTGYLPEIYLVPATARTPVKNQQQRGTCWIFATIAMLEGSYRKSGYERGYLAENEYVSLSEQVLSIGLVDYCTKNPENKYCLGGPAKNTSSDGDPSWIYYMRDEVAKYITPDAVCPYTPSEEEQFECPDFAKGVEGNPLKFELKDIRAAYTIKQIKELLLEKQQAMAWGHLVLDAAFDIPCSDPTNPKAGSEECTKCLHPCTASSDGCCSQYVASGYTQDGIFRTFKQPAIGGGHAMTIIGWNDNFRVESGIRGHDPVKSVGGFILKNSWSPARGHSAEYWAQQISTIEENTICPGETNAKTWMPATVSCMLKDANVTTCAPNAFKYVRDHWVRGATTLKCSGRSKAVANALGWGDCDPTKHYALAALDSDSMTPWVTVRPDSEATMVFHLLEWDPENTTEGAKLVETNQTTWYGIESLLTPVEIVGNSDDCGVYFMPYETFLQSDAMYPTYGHDTPSVTYFEVEWDKSSYLKNAAKGTYSYELLKNSTHKYIFPPFHGPYDLDATAPVDEKKN